MKRRPRTRIFALLAASALAIPACGDDDDNDENNDDAPEFDDGVMDDFIEEEDVEDAVDLLAEQYESMGIERAQAECLVDAQRDLQLDANEPFDPALAAELLEQCGIDPETIGDIPTTDGSGEGSDDGG